MAHEMKVRRVRFNMLSLGRTARTVGFWFCVWIASRLAFDVSVAITSTVWFAALKVMNWLDIIRDTILNS